MFRLLFARRADWAAFTIACVLSLTLMSLGRGPQARAIWFVQHTVLAPVNAVVGWLDAGVGVYWENQKLKKRLAQMQMEEVPEDHSPDTAESALNAIRKIRLDSYKQEIQSKIAEASQRSDDEMLARLMEQRIQVDRDLISLSRK